MKACLDNKHERIVLLSSQHKSKQNTLNAFGYKVTSDNEHFFRGTMWSKKFDKLKYNERFVIYVELVLKPSVKQDSVLTSFRKSY